LAAWSPFFRPDWPFSPLDDASLFDPGRRRAFLCAQVGHVAPSAILIGASRGRLESQSSDPRGLGWCRLTLECWLLLLVLPPRCYEAEVKTPWQSSRTSGKQDRLRRYTRKESTRKGERESERKRTRRRPYLEKEISEEHFAPRTTELLLLLLSTTLHSTTTTTTTLSFRSRSPASVRSLHRGLFPQPVAPMDLTDEK